MVKITDCLKVTATCPFCGKVSTLYIDDIWNYGEWVEGNLSVQEAFPEFTPEERELLLTGICSDCWI